MYRRDTGRGNSREGGGGGDRGGDGVRLAAPREKKARPAHRQARGCAARGARRVRLVRGEGRGVST